MLDLLLTPLAAGLIIVLTHAYFGLHVIEREVIFVDLALAQIAALGGTVAFLLGAAHGSSMAYVWSFGFTLLGALIFSVSRMDDSPVPQEAIIGITYVVASAAVILLSSFSAEGSEHLRETLTGSLIWVTWPTVLKVALSYGAIGLFHFLLRDRMLGITFDAERTPHVRVWDFVFFATVGVIITSSVQIAGVLMVFSVLVIPAVIAFFYARTFRGALLLAWASGILAVMLGIGLSFSLDLTTGPVIVCAFGFLLILALMFRRRFGRVVTHPSQRGLKVGRFERPATASAD
ncbi:MAG: metal ABC transporter permease [Gemmatimonadetes bacterium]|nr:metal ABC transporter permease [Gemmatimonadota bacterium]